jgi:cell wall-associated NlpC family hydrolase
MALMIPAVGCGEATLEAEADGVVDSEDLTGSDDSETASQTAELSSVLPVGTRLASTTGVNLRVGPSTRERVILVVPRGAGVATVEAAPRNGFYKVEYAGRVGWSHGAYYRREGGGSTPGGQAPAPNRQSPGRDEAIARGKSSVGFSYWWGHGRFRPEGPTPATAGACSGSCPGCSHRGSYGADCSGFVAKAWQVPSSNSDLTSDSHPYSTWSFVRESASWRTVSRSAVQRGDALVYNSNGAGHVMLYESGDAWGSVWAYECKGCSYGCVHNLRPVSSAYKAIARSGW